MEQQDYWDAFACTGNILCYLDYKQAQKPEVDPAGDSEHGDLCNDRFGLKRDPL